MSNIAPIATSWSTYAENKRISARKYSIISTRIEFDENDHKIQNHKLMSF